MGFALAEACAARGAEVTLIAGPVALKCTHEGINRIDVASAQDMYEACMKHFDEQDAAILCAAVADYRPAIQAERKIKRNGEELTITLIPNPDIAAELGRVAKSNQTLVGFALETNNEEYNALEKMKRKNLDFIVLNSLQDKGAGFQVDTNKITLLHNDGTKTPFPLKSKSEVAEDIVDRMIQVMRTKEKNG